MPRVAAAQPYVGPEFDLEPGPAPDMFRLQSQPAVAFDGTHYLAVWVDLSRMTNGFRILAQRVDRVGRVLDTVFEVTRSEMALASPAVAFDGTDFVVVWQQSAGLSQTIQGQRVGRTGAIVGSTFPIISGAEQAQPRIACGPSQCLVVSRESITMVGGQTVAVSAIVPSAMRASVLYRSPELIGTVSSPNVSFANGQFLVVWAENRSGFGGTMGVIRRVVARGGDLVLMPPSDLWSVGDSVNAIAMAAGGTQHLVVWHHGPAAGGPGPVEAARVDSNGTPLDLTPRSLAASVVSTVVPTVAFDGSNYLVAGDGPSALTSSADILAVRVSPRGDVLDTSAFGIATTEANEIKPAAVGDGHGRVLVAYATNLDARARILGFEGAPGLCASNAGCATGFCLDGECCDRFCDNGGDPCVTASCAGGTCTRATVPGCADAGTMDASIPDAAHGDDAGPSDGGMDAALETPGSGLVFRGGACACRAAGAPGRGGESFLAAVAALAVVAGVRRRSSARLVRKCPMPRRVR
jgi:hypothetical protein